jgi:hypothetical protein
VSTTWFIAKEYLKRLQISFEENARKTFSVRPQNPQETVEIEVFPGTSWITLTTRLMDLGTIPEGRKKSAYEKLLKSNAKLAEVSFGIDKKDCLIIRNAIPVEGISYDAFSSTYEAHVAGIKFFQQTLHPVLEH